jgi:hypothetical protein
MNRIRTKIGRELLRIMKEMYKGKKFVASGKSRGLLK